jgi:hypothetical protein
VKAKARLSRCATPKARDRKHVKEPTDIITRLLSCTQFESISSPACSRSLQILNIQSRSAQRLRGDECHYHNITMSGPPSPPSAATFARGPVSGQSYTKPGEIFLTSAEREETNTILDQLRDAQVLWSIGRTSAQQAQASKICDELLAKPHLPSIIRLKTLLLLISIEQDTIMINDLLESALSLYSVTVRLNPRGVNKDLDKLFDDARAALDAHVANQAENDHTLMDPHPDTSQPDGTSTQERKAPKPKIESMTGNQSQNLERHVPEVWDPAAERQREGAGDAMRQGTAKSRLTFVDEDARQRQRRIVAATEERLRAQGLIENDDSMLWQLDAPVAPNIANTGK